MEHSLLAHPAACDVVKYLGLGKCAAIKEHCLEKGKIALGPVFLWGVAQGLVFATPCFALQLASPIEGAKAAKNNRERHCHEQFQMLQCLGQVVVVHVILSRHAQSKATEILGPQGSSMGGMPCVWLLFQGALKCIALPLCIHL